jgi:TIR domain
VKIFISYSRRDAGDFAERIQNHFASFKGYDVFTDVNSIKLGDVWTNTIEGNISSCDIFVVIVTHGALQSPHIENEVLQAQREKKRIIPFLHRSVIHSEIKWGLNKIQGVEFEDKYELARNLYSKWELIRKQEQLASYGEPEKKKLKKPSMTLQFGKNTKEQRMNTKEQRIGNR